MDLSQTSQSFVAYFTPHDDIVLMKNIPHIKDEITKGFRSQCHSPLLKNIAVEDENGDA
jgi:hypothetical protein